MVLDDLQTQPYTIHKNSKWVIDLNINVATIELTKKNLKEKIFMTLAQAKILRQDTNVSTIKEKLINWINEN